MLPVLFRIGPVPINSYGLMIATGFLVALYFILRDARKAGLDEKAISDAAFFVLPIGILGTRSLHIVMYPETYSWSDPVGWFAIWRGGLVFQGESDGNLTALDSDTGEVLWQFNTGAGVNAPPIAFTLDGENFIAVAAGGSSLWGSPKGDAIFVFGLPKAWKADKK